ncbi:phospho-sugar mutase [Virgibacillus alimentarius]|uniref:Phosphoglucomutase n=1 Tax=Virgibacillus alimentarius TaxID=698769 RepID=A0ABS4S8Y9_9BACI|nr:phospho-sugar mutase [Virgibacillus alimentarius]MBP2257955.1 phosphoglucomutase [Virgibacillus alimentarius]
MTSWEKAYEKWNSFQDLDPALKKELNQMKEDKVALEDAFYTELTFGTGGMRGILGPGRNRMNIYTVRKAVNGLANYIKVNCVNVKDRGVVVAYDSRYMSKEFAVEAAKVLGAYGIKTHVFESLRPTPLLSFAVRYLGTTAGIMITASHNPPEYNGFKVYNEDGGQITPDEADHIVASIQQTENELTVPILEKEVLEEKGLLNWIGNEVDHAYLEQLKQISKMEEQHLQQDKDLQVVFTPLHGTASKLVMEGLKQLNFPNVAIVEEQAKPDPEFSTVDSPNPEEHQAFTMAIEQGKEKGADILLGTDPDADRLGVAVKDEDGVYSVLTGNQLGSLLLDYLLSHIDQDVFKNGKMIKSIVTTELGRAIASSHGAKTVDVLTGFKYIGEKIKQYDATGETFIFGFEESYGYLIRSFVRDKDAIQAAVVACEMADYWKRQGKTLLDALELLYEKHGYYQEGLSSITLKGIEGSRQIEQMMKEMRNNPLSEIAGIKVEKFEDYLTCTRTFTQHEDKKETIELPRENVLKYVLEKDSWVCLRPSGTEPKIKCYYGARGENMEESKQRLEILQTTMNEMMDRILKNC